jgi:hypothetical protein
MSEQTPSWHVTVCVHRPITGAQADGLFDTLADAAHGWEPAGVDVDVSGGPCYCRESPAAVARVVDAAQEMARALRLVTAIGGALSKPGETLVAALDALDADADPATERDFDEAAAAGTPVSVVGTPPWQVHEGPPPTHGTPTADLPAGWNNRTWATELIAAAREPVLGVEPVFAADDADYLEALLAERDRWRQRAETAEARVDGQAWAELTAEVKRLDMALRVQTEINNRLRADLQAAIVTIGALRDELSTTHRDTDHELCLTQLREYAEGAQADLATERAHVERLKQVALARLNEINGLQAQLTQAEEYAREAGDTASTVEANAEQDCRDAAADALDWAADQAAVAPVWSAAVLRIWAAGVRTGQRTIPTQLATTTEDLPEWERELLDRQEGT